MRALAIGHRVATWLYPRRRIQLAALLSGPLGWLAIAYLGALVVLLLNAFWAKDAFTGRVEPFAWTLDAFADIAANDVYRTIAVRTVVMAALVTLTDVVLAFPIAYYMARVASPRTAGMLVIAVLMPLWAAYLVKVYAWRTILQGNGLLDGDPRAARHRGSGPGRDRQRVARPQLPVAAVHDPADLRRPGTDPELAARSLGGPRRHGAARRSGGSSCRCLSRRSSPARSSPSR